MRLPRMTTRKQMIAVAVAGGISAVVLDLMQIGVDGLFRWIIHPPWICVLASPFVAAGGSTLAVTLVKR
jgi:hypothetical protein